MSGIPPSKKDSATATGSPVFEPFNRRGAPSTPPGHAEWSARRFVISLPSASSASRSRATFTTDGGLSLPLAEAECDHLVTRPPSVRLQHPRRRRRGPGRNAIRREASEPRSRIATWAYRDGADGAQRAHTVRGTPRCARHGRARTLEAGAAFSTRREEPVDRPRSVEGQPHLGAHSVRRRPWPVRRDPGETGRSEPTTDRRWPPAAHPGPFAIAGPAGLQAVERLLELIPCGVAHHRQSHLTDYHQARPTDPSDGRGERRCCRDQRGRWTRIGEQETPSRYAAGAC